MERKSGESIEKAAKKCDSVKVEETLGPSDAQVVVTVGVLFS